MICNGRSFAAKRGDQTTLGLSLSHSGWRAFKGGFDRHRRELRHRLLEPLLVGRPTLRGTVMRALAARGHLILCDLGCQRMFVDPSDRAIGDALIWRGAYQRDEFDRALALLVAAGRLPPKTVFLDLGANIGTHTVYAMRSGHFASAVVFEPEPHNARLLAMNVDINGFADRVTVVEKAAGAAPGRAVMHLHPRNKGAHAIGFAPADDGLDQVEIAVVRPDEVLRDLGVALADIGLVWMDTEGYEPHALVGLGEIVTRGVPIAFEFFPARYEAAVKRDVVQLLATHYTCMCRLAQPGRCEPAPVEALANIEGREDVLVY
jgi:FkbM family methyltransferase